MLVRVALLRHNSACTNLRVCVVMPMYPHRSKMIRLVDRSWPRSLCAWMAWERTGMKWRRGCSNGGAGNAAADARACVAGPDLSGPHKPHCFTRQCWQWQRKKAEVLLAGSICETGQLLLLTVLVCHQAGSRAHRLLFPMSAALRNLELERGPCAKGSFAIRQRHYSRCLLSVAALRRSRHAAMPCVW